LELFDDCNLLNLGSSRFLPAATNQYLLSTSIFPLCHIKPPLTTPTFPLSHIKPPLTTHFPAQPHQTSTHFSHAFVLIQGKPPLSRNFSTKSHQTSIYHNLHRLAIQNIQLPHTS
jgi:hypothetical protein